MFFVHAISTKRSLVKVVLPSLVGDNGGGGGERINAPLLVGKAE